MIRAVLFLTIVSGLPAINAVAADEDQWDRQLRRQRMEEWEQWHQRQEQQQIERQEQLDRTRRDLDQWQRDQGGRSIQMQPFDAPRVQRY